MKLKKLVLVTTLVAGSAVPMLAQSPFPAAAQSNCSAGTWGGYATSGTITGPGHVDVKCSIGSARSASITFV